MRTHLAKDDGPDATFHQEAKYARGFRKGADAPLFQIMIVDVGRVPDKILLRERVKILDGKSGEALNFASSGGPVFLHEHDVVDPKDCLHVLIERVRSCCNLNKAGSPKILTSTGFAMVALHDTNLTSRFPTAAQILLSLFGFS